MSDIFIGIDIGGTSTRFAAFDENLNVMTHRSFPTPVVPGDGGAALGALVVSALGDLVAGLGGRPVAGVGVGVPGVIDRSAGQVRLAINLGIDSEPLDLAACVAEVSPAPCRVDNDVSAAALGAWRMLGPGATDLAYLSIGTGIAAGIVLRGRLHTGSLGVAGEIGHFPVVPGGSRCECGLWGCLETVASGAALSRAWPVGDGRLTAEDLAESAEAGNPRARDVLQAFADHLAWAVHLLVITYGVDQVVIGGGVADAGTPLLDSVTAALQRLEERSSFVRLLALPRRVALKPDGPVGALGAALLPVFRDEA